MVSAKQRTTYWAHYIACSTGAVTLAASDVGALASTSLGAANGAAQLGSDQKLLPAQLPDLAIVDYLGSVASQSAMLALTGQKGDWCIRSDDGKVYTITGSDPTQASSWTAMSYPTGTNGTVTSVALSTPGVLYSVASSPVTGAGTLQLTLIAQAVNTVLAGPASGSSGNPSFRALVPSDLPVMGASGASHAAGIVPDPGSTAGTTKFLREDGTWQVPAGGGSGGSSTLAGDADVSLSSPANKDLLAYDTTSGKWKNKQPVLTGSAASTLDPSNKASAVTLSNGNLTAVFAGGVHAAVFSTVQRSSGKWYFELTFVSGQVTQNATVGIAPATSPTNKMLGYEDTSGSVGAAQNATGGVYAGGSLLGSSSSFTATGSVLGVAVDLDARKIWFRVGTGVWNGSSSNDPATGVGGYTIASSASMMPALSNDGAATWSYNATPTTTPSGFTAWGTQTLTPLLTDVNVSSPTDKQLLSYDAASGLWKNASLAYDCKAFYRGVPSASATVSYEPMPRAVSLPSGLTGSYAKARVAATASTTFNVQKNGSTVGTVVFAAGASSATFTASSAISLAAGDVLSIIAPSSPDATLADIGFVLTGTQ